MSKINKHANHANGHFTENREIWVIQVFPFFSERAIIGQFTGREKFAVSKLKVKISIWIFPHFFSKEPSSFWLVISKTKTEKFAQSENLTQSQKVVFRSQVDSRAKICCWGRVCCCLASRGRHDNPRGGRRGRVTDSKRKYRVLQKPIWKQSLFWR